MNWSILYRGLCRGSPLCYSWMQWELFKKTVIKYTVYRYRNITVHFYVDDSQIYYYLVTWTCYLALQHNQVLLTRKMTLCSIATGRYKALYTLCFYRNKPQGSTLEVIVDAFLYFPLHHTLSVSDAVCWNMSLSLLYYGSLAAVMIYIVLSGSALYYSWGHGKWLCTLQDPWLSGYLKQ